ncbi:MAG: hypothetical protein OXI66_18205 [Boseongicola sp.]|nr:hypothetical protein [Boseongicola sp.]MDE0347690.1 hypothetical protein [Boseongicola sp.]
MTELADAGMPRTMTVGGVSAAGEHGSVSGMPPHTERERHA